MEFNLTTELAIFLEKLLKDPILLVLIIFSTIAALVVIVKSDPLEPISFIRPLLEIVFLTKDDRIEKQEKIIDLQIELANIKEELSKLKSALNNDEIEKIRNEIKETFNKDLKSKISKEIKNDLSDLINDDFFMEHQLSIQIYNSIQQYLEKPDSLDTAFQIFKESEDRKNKNMFYDFIEQQKNSATTTKNVVVNLFIAMNLCLIIFYISFGRSTEEKTLLTIALTHISLSAFMVYIFKSSNTRISALLAILEDFNKISKIENLINTISNKQSISQNDVEIIKSTLINRSEREKSTQHPYEMILKGITNSSIQFRGGKIDIDANNKK